MSTLNWRYAVRLCRLIGPIGNFEALKVTHVKHLLLCLALSVCPSAGGVRQAPVAPVAPIALLTQFDQEPSAAVRGALQSELQAIMQPIGLHFEWRDLRPTENTSAVELVVVTFRGHCDLDQLQSASVMPGALGWTHVSNGIILPFSDVDCDAVRGFLQRSLMGITDSRREETYGRALARVLAHELYHVMANTSVHGGCGLAKSGFTVSELLSAAFTFEASEFRKLVESRTYKVLEKAAAIAAAASAP